MDRSKFYAALRRRDSGVFGTTISQQQVNALELFLNEGEIRKVPLRQLAYILATAYHEVGSSLQPRAENLNYTSAARIRQVWPSRFPTQASAQPFVRQPEKLANHVYGGRLGNNSQGDGWRYRGRGFVQITGRENYRRFGIEASPDEAMKPDTAARIIFTGMLNGSFTGKKLFDYINSTQTDYRNARRIINADVAANGEKISGYARGFGQALTEAGFGTTAVSAPAPIVIEKPVVADPEELDKPTTQSKTFWTWLLTGIGAPIAAFGNLDWRVQLALVVVIVAFAVYGIKRRNDLAKAVRDLKREFA